jgi:hypothetical protein
MVCNNVIEINSYLHFSDQLRQAIKEFGGIPHPQSFLPLDKIGKSAQEVVDGIQQILGVSVQIHVPTSRY